MVLPLQSIIFFLAKPFKQRILIQIYTIDQTKSQFIRWLDARLVILYVGAASLFSLFGCIDFRNPNSLVT